MARMRDAALRRAKPRAAFDISAGCVQLLNSRGVTGRNNALASRPSPALIGPTEGLMESSEWST
jgi:hypothetical protein